MKTQSKGKKIGLTILIILAVLLIGLAAFHGCKLASDMKFLKDQGLYNLVPAGDYALNVVRFGNENAEHRIIAMSGMGGGFPVQMRKMTAELEKDYELIYAARAGWDGSDDTESERTVEAIVEDYRTVLKNAGVPAPYILMAHSMGGTYASYWVSRYPDEIEAFVNIDGTYVEPVDDLPEQKPQNTLFLKALVNLGIGDIILPLMQKDSSYSAEEQRAVYALMLQSYASDAANNEAANVERNRNETWNALVSTDVPKLYISARDGYLLKEDILNGSGLSKFELEYYAPDFTGSDSERKDAACAAWLAECEDHIANELMPYLEKMGNCEVEYLAGDHFIFQSEPEKCAKIIQDFLDGLDG